MLQIETITKQSFNAIGMVSDVRLTKALLFP